MRSVCNKIDNDKPHSIANSLSEHLKYSCEPKIIYEFP